MIKHIIFDLGGVIIKHSHTINEDILMQIFGISRKQAQKDWDKTKNKLIMGTMSSVDFITNLRTKYNKKTSIEELHRLWIYLYEKEARDIDKVLLSAIDEFKKDFTVYIFTDTLDTHDAFNQKRGIYEHFTRVFKSYKLGVTKNNPESFQMILAALHADASECLFVDDSLSNINRAKQLGFRTVLYTERRQSLPDIMRSVSEK